MQILIIIFLFALAAFGYFFYAYNRLTQLGNTANTEWSQIDVNLKKRADLVPSLIEVVKGYAKHEMETLEMVSRRRAEASESVSGRGEGESGLSQHVAGVLALREAYPDLKANESFMSLQRKLFDLEEDIAERRTNYNSIVKAHNDFILKFPGNVVASMIGFSLRELFEFTGSREAPELNLYDEK